RQQGQPPSVDDLCCDCPELKAQLQQEINEFQASGQPAPAPGLQTPPLPPGPADPDATIPPSPSDPPKPAMRPLPSRYLLIRELGHGGMGVVYQARDLALNRDVAVKMILSGVHARTEELARFQSEAESLARLQHPNIVQIFEV